MEDRPKSLAKWEQVVCSTFLSQSANLRAVPSKRPRKAAKPSFLSPTVAAAATHPTRIHALMILSERTATAGEIGGQIGQSSQHVTYHLRQLEDLDLIEVAELRPMHGGRVITKAYRSTQRALFDQESWAAMSDTEQAEVTITILRMMSDDVNRAVMGATINDPPADDPDLTANHISRSPIAVDAEGWNEISAILEDTMNQVQEVHERSANRSEGSADLMSARVMMLQFLMPTGQ